MIILPSRNGKLLHTVPGVLASDCGGTVCNGLPQYITATLSGVSVSSVGYRYYGGIVFSFDTNSSFYNTNYALPYYDTVNGNCLYRLTISGTPNTLTEVYNSSGCTNFFRTPGIICYLYMYFTTKSIYVQIGNVSPGYSDIYVFVGNRSFSDSEWSDLIANRTATITSNDCFISSATASYCNKTALSLFNLNSYSEGGTCVLTW